MATEERRGIGPLRVIRWVLLALAVGIGIHLILPALPGMRQSLHVLGQINPMFVILAIACEVASNFAPAEMYRKALRAFGVQLSKRRAVQFTMALFTVGHVLPGGAGAAGVFAIDRLSAMGTSVASASTVTVMVAITSLTVLASLIALGAIGALFRGDLHFTYVLVVVIVALAWAGISAAIYAAFRSERARNRFLKIIRPLFRGKTLRNWFERIQKSVSEIAAHRFGPRELRAVGAWASVVWIFDAAALWLMLFSFGIHLHIGVLFVGYGVANILGSIPITPSGLGFVEAGLAGTLVAFGVPSSAAVISTLGYRLLSLWLPTLAGIPMYFRSRQTNGATPN